MEVPTITCWRASAKRYRVKLTRVVRSLLCEARQHVIKEAVAALQHLDLLPCRLEDAGDRIKPCVFHVVHIMSTSLPHS